MGLEVFDMNDPEIAESSKYLVITPAEKIKMTSMPFDGKTACWVPEHKEGFVSGTIVETKGDMVTVKTSKGETVTVKKDDAQPMNPPKYEKCEDMADLTYLSDATVLHNLRTRYMNWMIYTYSGLFCVVINPYKRLPVYTMKMINTYRGRKKNEVPPHLYSIADTAYQNMLRDRENQSMLITGESGAGKTENTKKVIQYLAYVGATETKKKDDGPAQANLEDQIVSANPVLEAYGNAKTTRNNNSSRFGKFIRIHFGPTGKIAGADIETYLLEKSRVIFQQPAERNYHIFYQLLSKQFPEYHKELLVEPDASLYHYIAQGMLTIDNVDDAEEMRLTDEAFDILGFTQEEKIQLFKCTGAICHFGNSKWKQRPREEQAEIDGSEECEKVSYLLGVESADLIKGLLKPRIKVGNEYVNKGQNKDQVVNSIGALSKSIFDRLFNWLVLRVNQTLDVKTKRQFFIGVLDIAGFEIFDYNGFEQLCINYTNERLQQFFNHHMFVLEQEEYKKEGIQWEMMNFGLDLQACIDLIEKPMGILSILEEECIVPKASDKTFQEKLYNNHLGKHPNFGKPKPGKGKAEAHFELHHYAGTVPYSITGWLDKNKDPINNTVAGLFKNSKTNKLLSIFFADCGEDPDEAKKAGGKSKKGGSMQTISATHRDQLNKLMLTLKQTHPHFVRCIIPNEIKTGGILDAHLVLHQLHCNGVLEGIRICRKGFPNRMIYAEFKQRYSILAPNVIPKGFVDATKATGDILKEIALGDDNYKLGNTKVFFRAGILGTLEELRDAAVSKIICTLQAQIRSFILRKNYKRMLEQKLALGVLQRNCKKYLQLRNWSWWKLYTKVKPLLSVARQEEEFKAKEEEFAKLKENFEKEEKLRKELEETLSKVSKEKNDLYLELEAERENTASHEDQKQKIIVQKAEVEAQLKELQSRLSEEEGTVDELESRKNKLENQVQDLRKDIEDLHGKVNKTEAEVKNRDSQIHTLQEHLAQQDEANAKLAREKKRLEETNQATLENLQKEEEKNAILNKSKAKLEQTLDEADDNLEREKKAKADLEKAKKKLEGDLKSAQGVLDEIGRAKSELEENLKKKDQDIKTLNARVEDEANNAANLQKRLKEFQARVEQLEEEVEVERQAKTKVEKQRADLARELADTGSRLEEVGGASVAQQELSKKREAELAKLRRDLEEANLQHEATAAQLRKKHQDAVNEMGEQIEQLQKFKNILEKSKNQLRSELDDANTTLEYTSKAKVAAEKLNKQLELQISEITIKLDESNRINNELNLQSGKLHNEITDLNRQLEDADVANNALNKAKQLVQLQLDEAKRAVEDESRQKQVLAQQLRAVTADYEQARDQVEEELVAKIELNKHISKLTTDVQVWKAKYEQEGIARAEELEEAKRKLAARLQEAEGQVEDALAKCNSLEKVKQRLQGEVEDLMIDVEKANANASAMEKKQRQFEKLIDEWKQKCIDITLELEASQKEARTYSTELFKLKTQYDEAQEQIEALRRENKNLADEIKDLMEQLGESGKAIHEIEKNKKRLEIEKEELQSALEEAEAAIQAEEAKVVRAQLELNQVRQEIERRLREKEEEFENTRRNHQRALESLQASLETETRCKLEALKQKKKLEGDINELEVALDGANRNIADLQKTIKGLQLQITEQQAQIEDEVRQKEEAREAAIAADRRAKLLAGELEEVRAALENAERARRAAESDLHHAADKISELATQNANLAAQKRKLESDLASVTADLDEAIAELKNSEERVKKATTDAARLAEELRQEQEHALAIEKLRKGLEQQVRDLQIRLDEAEENALKNGKRIIQKLEQRILELESELDLEQRHHQETIKEVRKNDRRLKELIFQSEEDRKNQLRLQELIDQLQNKLKAYKRQAEEAEDIASSNLAKYRKVQSELEETEERAHIVENQLTKVRAKSRSSVSALRVSPQREVIREVRAQSTVVLQRNENRQN